MASYSNIDKPSTSYSNIPGVDFWKLLLCEDGTQLLYEDGFRIILESSGSIYTKVTKPT